MDEFFARLGYIKKGHNRYEYQRKIGNETKEYVIIVSTKSVTFFTNRRKLFCFSKLREEKLWKQYAEDLTKLTEEQASEKIMDKIDDLILMLRSMVR